MTKFSPILMSCAPLALLCGCGGGSGGTSVATTASNAPVSIGPAMPTPAAVSAPTPAPADSAPAKAEGPAGWKPMSPMLLNLRQQNAEVSWSYALLTDGARRYEVRGGDQWSLDSATGAERSESYDPYKMEVGRTYQIAFKMMIEPGETNSASWLLITQATSVSDPGEALHSPPLALELAGDRFRVVTRDSSAALSTPADIRYVRQFDETQPMARGRWYDIKVQVVFGPFGNGLLKVWRDDVLLVDFNGALGFNDNVGPYLKQGVYRSPTAQTIAVQFRDLQLGLVD